MRRFKLFGFLLGFIQYSSVVLIPTAICFTVPGIKRGFFCHDPALSLPRLPDTVPNWLLVFWMCSPIFVLLTCEMLFNWRLCKSNSILCFDISWRNASFLFHRYIIDICLMHLILFTVKFFTGTHRPHFFETCKPDALLTCTPGTFVHDYECTNNDERFYNILDASQSFFSGHAASCAYSCTFIAWYLQKRMKTANIFVLPFIQSLLLALGYFGAISRVFDHRHHVVDVVAGGIVGVLTMAHVCFYLLRDFEFQHSWNDNRKILPQVSVVKVHSENEAGMGL